VGVGQSSAHEQTRATCRPFASSIGLANGAAEDTENW
jgi:hypothetical protein